MISVRPDCQLVFCVGVGGVGKTTFAAALAHEEALRGRKVLVLTADPARRLADALGVQGLTDAASRVTLSPGARGELHAAMLETKASADAIIRRASHDAERAQRVLDNKIYQAFSNTLSRSHAYAAMERIHQALHDARYDLIVVDTPPAQSALEILDAPARLVRFLDQRVVRWFLRPSEGSSGLRGGGITRRLLKTIAGGSLVEALSGFLSEMAFLREGFAARAIEVRDAIRSSRTEFVLVSAADRAGVRASRAVAQEVDDRGYRLGHVVLNRAFTEDIEPSLYGGTYPEGLQDLTPKLQRMIEWAAEDQARKRAAIEDYVVERSEPIWVLPEWARPLADPDTLAAWIRAAQTIERET